MCWCGVCLCGGGVCVCVSSVSPLAQMASDKVRRLWAVKSEGCSHGHMCSLIWSVSLHCSVMDITMDVLPASIWQLDSVLLVRSLTFLSPN